ncbi:MAG: molybdopterin-dependent oxidoreductase [Acidobacteria bacterium]|nr:molybdopterin-dependent oxidoreductase [Acidobacteriota bacterium]
MDRRNFLKLTAVTGTTSALAACGNPEHTLIRFVPDEDIEPGIAVWKPSVCPLCANGCGLTVRVMDADVEVVRGSQAGVVRKPVAKKLDGNAQHPSSHGGLCPRGQAAIQVTYHPDRIAQPLKRAGERGDGRYVAISWDQAIGELAAALDRLAGAGRQQALACLVRPGRSQRRTLVDTFLSRFGAPPALSPELFGDDVLRRANGLSFGRSQLPTIDLARARFVLSFGADFLGTWNSPVAHNASYGEMRQGRLGVRGVFVQVEARMSQTGASADQWMPARPATEGILALGIAHVIMAAKLAAAADAGRAGRLIDGWSSGLPEYTPARVQELTGVPAARIERLARQFGEIRPAVAVVSGPPLGHTNGLFTALAVNALNALVGGVERPGGLFFMPQLEAGSNRPARTIGAVAGEILGASASPVEAVLIDGANPVHASPRAWRVRDALLKVPFIASFGSFLDDTSVLADLILPDHSFLESWVDALPESGSLDPIASVAGPVMRPLYDTRAMPDVLIDVSKRLQRPLTPALPASFEAMLQASVERLQPGAADAWTKATEQGGWWGAARSTVPPAEPAVTRTVARTEPAFDGDAGEYPFHFLPYPSQAFGDGATAHLPWLQELPDPLTSAMWSSWVEVGTETATKLGISLGDVIEITSPRGSLRAPAVVSPGLAPYLIAMPMGQGHRTYTRYASGRGVNPAELLGAVTEPETGSLAWAATRVRIAKVGEKDGSLILFAGGMREAHPAHRL